MENKNCYVVTAPELGWDCVIRVYLANSEDDAKIAYSKDEDSWIFEDMQENIREYKEEYEDDGITDDLLIIWIDKLLDYHNIVFHSKDYEIVK